MKQSRCLAKWKSMVEAKCPDRGDGLRQGKRRIEWPSERNKGNSSPGIRLYNPQKTRQEQSKTQTCSKEPPVFIIITYVVELMRSRQKSIDQARSWKSRRTNNPRSHIVRLALHARSPITWNRISDCGFFIRISSREISRGKAKNRHQKA